MLNAYFFLFNLECVFAMNDSKITEQVPVVDLVTGLCVFFSLHYLLYIAEVEKLIYFKLELKY